MRRLFVVLFVVFIALPVLGTGSAGAATCGPDAFGYFWRDKASGAQYTNIPFVSPTSIDVPAPGADAPFVNFPFTFYGISYAGLFVSHAGFVSFVDPVQWDIFQPQCPPNTALPNGLIAPLWAGSGNVMNDSLQYEYFPSLGVFKIRWESHTAMITSFQFELLLYADGRIKFQYDGYTGNPGTWSLFFVGIEDHTGTDGLWAKCSTRSNCGFAFSPYTQSVLEYFPPPRLNCAAAQPLACGQVFNAPAPAPANPNVSVFACNPTGTYLGNESVFSFTLTDASEINAAISNFPGRNLDLFLLDSCNEFRCLGFGDNSLMDPFLPPGTYYLVVDGATTADTSGPFTISLDCQKIALPIACGQTLSGNTTGQRNRISNLPCSPNPLTGPDQIFQLDIPATTNVDITLSSPAPLDLEVLSGLSPVTCMTWGDNHVRLWAVSGTYFIVVDGNAGVSGSFDLTVNCGIRMDCTTPPPVIACGDVVSGDTSTGVNRVEEYSCGVGYTGPELVYAFDNPTPQEVTVLLGNAAPGLDIFLMTDCNEGTCIRRGPFCGEVLPAGRYYVAVDGAGGASGPFEMQVICGRYQYLSERRRCPEAPEAPTDISTTQATEWHFNSGLYCGTGCDFEMYVTVDCGNEFHIPFYDVESGHIAIYSLSERRYMDLTAQSTGGFFQQGQRIDWVSNGCPNEGLAGNDPRFNNQTMDISFTGNPTICGVFRLELYNWGGYDWYLYANCSGANRPQFTIYDNACDAINAYSPAPQLILENLNVTENCPDVEVQVDVRNIGCLDAEVSPVLVTATPGGQTAVDAGDIPSGESRTLTFPLTLPSTPAVVSVTVDPSINPGDSGLLSECSEEANAVACQTQGGARTFSVPVCVPQCPTPPAVDVGPDLYTCQGDPIAIGVNLAVAQGTQPFQYHWEPAADLDNPNSANPTVLNPVADTVYTCTVTDRDNCVGQDLLTLFVLPDVPAQEVPPPLKLRKSASDVELYWPKTNDPSYNVRMDQDKKFQASQQIASGLVNPYYLHAGAVFPPPLYFYRVSASNCRGDEGPF
jgi:hypothetical protein